MKPKAEIAEEVGAYWSGHHISTTEAILKALIIRDKEFLEMIKWVERKRITDNNDYISIPIGAWNVFKSAVEGRK